MKTRSSDPQPAAKRLRQAEVKVKDAVHVELFVWVISGFSCCGPGGGAYSNPLGRLSISGVYTDKEEARASFYKEVASTWTSGIERIATLKRECGANGCKKCFKFCAAEQQKHFQDMKVRMIKDEEKAYKKAVRTQKRNPTDAGEERVRICAENLQDAKDDKQVFNNDEEVAMDFLREWLGPGEDELYQQVANGEIGAWRHFHFHDSITAGDDGSLRFYEEVCGDIIDETCMKKMRLV